MAGVLTGIDKALLLRAARLLVVKAAFMEKACAGNWAGRRPEKQTFDALHRDARDLRALVVRLSRLPVRFSPEQVKVLKEFGPDLWTAIDGGQPVEAGLALDVIAGVVPELSRPAPASNSGGVVVLDGPAHG